jgi:hypothetical protein
MATNYDSDMKDVQRGVVMNRYDFDKRPIIFLEAESGEATKFFVDGGVRPEHVIPVNDVTHVAAAITEKTKVMTVCENIDTYIKRLSSCKPDSASIVWLDYTQRNVDREVLYSALLVAPIVYVTLSTRGLNVQRQNVDIRKCIPSNGKFMQEPARCEGKSGVMNMVTFIVKRKDATMNVNPVCTRHYVSERRGVHEISADKRKAAVSTEEASRVPPKKKKQCHPRCTEEVFEVNDKVFVWWNSTTKWLTGIVEEVEGDQIKIHFDCDGQFHWKNKKHVKKNTEQKIAKDYVGKDIHIPCVLWKKAMKIIKKVNDKYVGKITGTDADRLTVSLLLSGSGKFVDTKWKLTCEQADCFLV